MAHEHGSVPTGFTCKNRPGLAHGSQFPVLNDYVLLLHENCHTLFISLVNGVQFFTSEHCCYKYLLQMTLTCLSMSGGSEIFRAKVGIFKYVNITPKFSKDLYQSTFPKTVKLGFLLPVNTIVYFYRNVQNVISLMFICSCLKLS